MSAKSDQARDEAYASAPTNQVVLGVLMLDNPSFSSPLYFIMGTENDTQVTLEDGTTQVTAKASAFRMTPPGFEDGGPVPAQLQIDGVSYPLYKVLRGSVNAGPISVVYREYVSTDFTTPVYILRGMLLKRAQLGATSAQGELSLKEIATQAFPRITYDINTYTGLWNSG